MGWLYWNLRCNLFCVVVVCLGMKMRVLVACEESQATALAFRGLGHEAYSCDLLPCSGGHPEWHLRCSVFDVLGDGWDLMVAHPPCTFLAGSGVQWLSHPDDRGLPFGLRRAHPYYPERRKDMESSLEFVIRVYESGVPRVAIENPVGLLNTLWRKPDQVVQPWMFGDEATKTTCLWLKNLPLLRHTGHVGRGERTVFSSGKSHPKWYADALAVARTPEERRTLRSKTFPGMAAAFADQWGLAAVDGYMDLRLF